MARYLARFEKSLSPVPEEDRGEMVRELENHIAEATHAGAELEQVIRTLGPADRLADAYRVELALQGQGRGLSSWGGFLAFFGVVATTSLPTFVIVAVLGLIGIGFTLSGLLSMVIGPLALVLPDSMSEVSAPFPTPLAELSAVAIGAVLVVIGLVSLGLLSVYVRFMHRALRRLVGEVRASA